MSELPCGRWYAVSCVVALLLSCGCVRYERADAGLHPGRFTALWERDLSAFEQQVAMERHTGAADDWTEVSEAWLDLVNCEEIATPESFRDPLARYIHASLTAEELRRALSLYQGRAQGPSSDNLGAIYVAAAVPGFFERDADAVPQELIQWPVEHEAWADEVPAPTGIATECGGLRERVFATKLRPADEASPARNFQDWFELYVDAMAVMRAAFEELDAADAAGAPTLLQWRADFWLAAYAHELAAAWAKFAEDARRRVDDGVSAEENRARMQAASARAAELRALAEQRLPGVVGASPAAAEPYERARARLLFAWYELQAGRPSVALEQLAFARAEGLEEENFWAARYLELRVASDAAQWAVALELSDGLPPRTSRYHGAYFYRVAVAARRMAQEDRFLNLAMKAFRDRTYKADPFLRALYWEMLQTLADYPFDERVVEMLEDLGPRGDTAERVEEYARVALDRGQPANADAAARWLLARHHDARFHPRYHGILALAAFLDDDPARFETAVVGITARPGQVADAVPAARQPAFFAHADTELGRVLRQMLPIMAEWGDDDSARARRQRWLRVIVAHAQGFLRDTDATLARPQLVELYRLASKLLDDHPRGYAERVGEAEPAPLVLGTVRVERRDLDEHEPEVVLEMPSPHSLTLIPRDDLAPSQWPFRWPEEER